MKKLIHQNTQIIFGMSVVNKDEFDLPYDIWLDPAGDSRPVKHSLPRVKIKIDCKLIPFLISDDPKPLTKNFKIKHQRRICEWIVKNYDVLMKQWNGEITDKEALTMLTK